MPTTDTHFVTKKQTAGKRHKCSACRLSIEAGSRYLRAVSVPNGEEHTDEAVRARRLPVFKYHIECWDH